MGTAVLLLSLGLLCAGRIATALWLCAAQALCAAGSLAGASAAAALPALALNGIVLPLVIARLAGAGSLRPAGHGWIGWALALAVPALAAGLLSGGAATGAAVTLLGLALGIVRRHPLAPAIGLLSAQNGLVVVAAAYPAFSLPAGAAVAVPLLPGLALADHWLRRA
jgi:hypothetical protein